MFLKEGISRKQSQKKHDLKDLPKKWFL